MAQESIDELTGFAKRAGFFWPAAELYGGAAGLYDYGHLGAAMKRRFESLWLNFFVERRDNYFLIEGSTMLPEKPLVASGHASRFNDVIVACSSCKSHYRADVLLNEMNIAVPEGASPKQLEQAIADNKVKCPKCKGTLGEPKEFNMMIGINLGPDKQEKGYLRPETAQSAYLNFFREFNVLRKRLPLGLAIIGKAYRNEISPRQGLYRMRELTQAELQIFFDPQNWHIDDSAVLSRKLNVVLYNDGKMHNVTGKELIAKFEIPDFYAYHLCLIDYFYKQLLHVPDDKFRFLEKGGIDKAFYNKLHMDIEVNVESWNGFKEVGGLHYRGDYDLSCHSKGSGQDLSVDADGKKVMPHVLELSFGVDRNIWMLLDTMYVKAEERSVLSIPAMLAPFNAAILPLQKDEKIMELAKGIYKNLNGHYNVHFDESGSIGRRYARMDEIGTPFCITIDFDSVDDKSQNFNTVTLRDRDTKTQQRVQINELQFVLYKKIFAALYEA